MGRSIFNSSQLVLGFVFVLFVFLVPIEAAIADSAFPFADQRITDPTGHYYAVLKRPGGPRHIAAWGRVELTIAERGPGTLPVDPVRARVTRLDGADSNVFVMSGPDVNVRPGDVVHGRVLLDNPPATALVSGTGLGVVLFDRYVPNYSLLSPGPRGETDPALQIVSIKGEIRHALKLDALFTNEQLLQFHLGPTIFWLYRNWIDEVTKEIVLIGKNEKPTGDDPVSVVNFETGAIRRGGRAEVLRAISSLNPGGLASALDVAKRWRIKEATPQLPGILANQRLALEARIRAAVLLAAFGDKSGGQLLLDTAKKSSKEVLKHSDWQIESEKWWEIHHYCVHNLPDVLAEQALPVLREVAQEQDYPAVAYQAFWCLGKKCEMDLIEMIKDEKNPAGQVFAADVLGDNKAESKEAIAALIGALGGSARCRLGRPLAKSAARSLGDIGPAARAALPALAEHLNDQDEDVRKACADAIEKIKR